MIKAVIFDWNGVIIDDMDANARANCDVIQKLSGRKVSVSTWFKEIKQDWRVFFIKHGVKEEEIPKVLLMTPDYYLKYAAYAKPVNHVTDILNYLKEKKIKMGVLSGTCKKNIIENIKMFSLNGYFDFIISAEDVQNQKPHPEPLEKAVKETGFTEKEIIYVDDMSTIFQHARNLGIITVGFESRISGEFHDADYIINDIRKIKEIIENR